MREARKFARDGGGGEDEMLIEVHGDPEAGRGHVVPEGILPKGPEDFPAYQAWCQAHREAVPVTLVRIKRRRPA
jgi:hypothetical protein